MPRVSTQAFLAPKQGCEARECEDALSVNAARTRFCIADGATEGFGSRYWARLLVKHWTRSERPILTPEQLTSWATELGSRFDRHWQRRKLPWFAEEKARSGAFAAFLGVSFLDSHEQLYWQAVGIGDACLILWRQNAIVTSFPLDDPDRFGYWPVLLSSKLTGQQTALERVEIRSGPVEPGDAFFLLTDAIAAWFLRAAKSAPEQITKLQQTLDCGKHEALSEFIDGARTSGALRNDDVGILRVRVVP